jgi:hypothetical protein
MWSEKQLSGDTFLEHSSRAMQAVPYFLLLIHYRKLTSLTRTMSNLPLTMISIFALALELVVQKPLHLGQ